MSVTPGEMIELRVERALMQSAKVQEVCTHLMNVLGEADLLCDTTKEKGAQRDKGELFIRFKGGTTSDQVRAVFHRTTDGSAEFSLETRNGVGTITHQPMRPFSH